jgi:TetR/AcrR family transcriptional regulator
MTMRKLPTSPAGRTATGVKSKKGRSPRSSETTRERILKHSTAEFSAKGYNGARVDGIAARCRLSKNTLYYYFGSKEGLFTAVLELMYERLRVRQQDFSTRAYAPIEAMQRLVKHTFCAFLEYPEAIRLLNEENLHKARHIRRSKRLRELYDPLVDTLDELLRRGAACGVFRPGIDPTFLYITLSSLAYHFISNSYTLQIALATDLTSEAAHKAWLSHITDLVLLYCVHERAKQSGQRLTAGNAD